MPLEFHHLDGHAVHRQRARDILARHPEVRQLMGPNATSALWVFGLVALQWLAAFLLRDVAWLWIIVAAYLFGAFVNHALYVLIHECTHNLVFRKKTHNNYLGMLCDFALAFPSAMAFRKYHLLHHQHLGEYEMDPDIVCHTEGRLVRDSAWRKALWVALLGVSQALRPLKVKGVKALDRWIIANILIIAVVDLFIFLVIGPEGARLSRAVDVLRARAPSRRRPLDPGALRDQKGAGDLFVLWSLEPDLLQHGLPQRAPRLRRGSVEQPAQAEGSGTGILRQSEVLPILDRGPAQVYLRSLAVDLQPGGARRAELEPTAIRAQDGRGGRAAAARPVR